MAPGIGAGGLVGIALESVAGTYVAPTKYVPVNSESLQFMGEPQFRRPIRESADAIWAVPSDVHIAGDMEMDALEDVVPYFLLCARTAVQKTDDTPNFTYAFTPTSAAVPTRTMSITVERNGQVFGYVGCVVSSFAFSLNEGILGFNCSILGLDEDTESAPTPTWPTTVPFGAGQYDIQIPTSTQVFDLDTFELTIEDNGEPQYRAKDTGRGAQFIKFGERNIGLTVARDFENKTDYSAFKAITAQSITLVASKGANNSISMLVPVAIKNSYEVGLSSQGDLVRGQIQYTGLVSSAAYTITVATQEDITLA